MVANGSSADWLEHRQSAPPHVLGYAIFDDLKEVYANQLSIEICLVHSIIYEITILTHIVETI